MIRLDVRVTSAGLVTNEKRKLRALMRAAGSEVAAVARANLRRAAGNGRVYWSKDGRRAASASGQPPAALSGQLAKSIKVYPYKSGEGVAVRARMFYALFLEKGAVGGGGRKGSRNRRGKPQTQRVLLPRPFLTTALDSRAGSLGARIRAAIVDDIKFKRMKA